MENNNYIVVDCPSTTPNVGTEPNAGYTQPSYVGSSKSQDDYLNKDTFEHEDNNTYSGYWDF